MKKLRTHELSLIVRRATDKVQPDAVSVVEKEVDNVLLVMVVNVMRKVQSATRAKVLDQKTACIVVELDEDLVRGVTKAR